MPLDLSRYNWPIKIVCISAVHDIQDTAWNDHQSQINMPITLLVVWEEYLRFIHIHEDNPPLLTAVIMLYIIKSIKYIHFITEKSLPSIISATSAPWE